MAKYTFKCEMNHEPVTLEVESDSDDSALEMMLEKTKPHLNDAHSEMAGKSDDEMREMIKAGWTKTE